MVNPEILQQIRHDFNTSGANSLLEIPENLVDEFWNWFENAASIISLAENKLDQISYEGHISNRCFGNSQSIYYQTGVPYYEGFVEVGLSYIHHGYNVYENGVHDVTYESNLDRFLKINGKPLGPYYGIEAPAEIALENKDELDALGYNTPLLFKMFQALK